MSNKYVKGVLPSGWYSFTITQYARSDDPKWDGVTLNAHPHEGVALCATVDSGPNAWRHIWLQYPITYRHRLRLQKMAEAINIEIVDDDWELTGLQLLGTRFRGKVAVVTRNNSVIKNEIIEFKPALGRPEFNVTKQYDDSHFFEQKNQRKNPME